MDEIMDEIKLIHDVQSEDMVRVTVSHPSLGIDIFVPFLRAEDLNGEVVYNKIEKVMHSNKELSISDGDMTIDFMHTVLASGSGRNPQNYGAYFNLKT